MSNYLIPIRSDGGKQSCNARDLHSFLGVGKDFSNWLKDRIEKYGFSEGEDFLKLETPNLANQVGHGGARRTIDYFLSLDMGKELSMVENNDKGREARRYFIEVEKKAREAVARNLEISGKAATELAKLSAKIDALTKKIRKPREAVTSAVSSLSNGEKRIRRALANSSNGVIDLSKVLGVNQAALDKCRQADGKPTLKYFDLQQALSANYRLWNGF